MTMWREMYLKPLVNQVCCTYKWSAYVVTQITGRQPVLTMCSFCIRVVEEERAFLRNVDWIATYSLDVKRVGNGFDGISNDPMVISRNYRQRCSSVENTPTINNVMSTRIPFPRDGFD